MKILKLKPGFMVKVNGPATISIERAWGKLITIGIDCAKDVDIKCGTRKRISAKPGG